MEMWWLILPGILIAVLMFILFSRIVIDLNSEEGYAGVRFGRIFQASLFLNEAAYVARIRIAWWKKEFDLMQSAPVKKEADRHVPSSQPASKKIAVRKLLRKMKGVLQSFRINRCEVSVNTGDMALNGILFPWFFLLRRRTGRNFSITFTGDTVVILQAENSIARMLWAYIKS